MAELGLPPHSQNTCKVNFSGKATCKVGIWSTSSNLEIKALKEFNNITKTFFKKIKIEKGSDSFTRKHVAKAVKGTATALKMRELDVAEEILKALSHPQSDCLTLPAKDSLFRHLTDHRLLLLKASSPLSPTELQHQARLIELTEKATLDSLEAQREYATNKSLPKSPTNTPLNINPIDFITSITNLTLDGIKTAILCIAEQKCSTDMQPQLNKEDYHQYAVSLLRTPNLKNLLQQNLNISDKPEPLTIQADKVIRLLRELTQANYTGIDSPEFQPSKNRPEDPVLGGAKKRPHLLNTQSVPHFKPQSHSPSESLDGADWGSVSSLDSVEDPDDPAYMSIHSSWTQAPDDSLLETAQFGESHKLPLDPFISKLIEHFPTTSRQRLQPEDLKDIIKQTAYEQKGIRTVSAHDMKGYTGNMIYNRVLLLKLSQAGYPSETIKEIKATLTLLNRETLSTPSLQTHPHPPKPEQTISNAIPSDETDTIPSEEIEHTFAEGTDEPYAVVRRPQGKTPRLKTQKTPLKAQRSSPFPARSAGPHPLETTHKRSVTAPCTQVTDRSRQAHQASLQPVHESEEMKTFETAPTLTTRPTPTPRKLSRSAPTSPTSPSVSPSTPPKPGERMKQETPSRHGTLMSQTTSPPVPPRSLPRTSLPPIPPKPGERMKQETPSRHETLMSQTPSPPIPPRSLVSMRSLPPSDRDLTAEQLNSVRTTYVIDPLIILEEKAIDTHAIANAIRLSVEDLDGITVQTPRQYQQIAQKVMRAAHLARERMSENNKSESFQEKVLATFKEIGLKGYTPPQVESEPLETADELGKTTTFSHTNSIKKRQEQLLNGYATAYNKLNSLKANSDKVWEPFHQPTPYDPLKPWLPYPKGYISIDTAKGFPREFGNAQVFAKQGFSRHKNIAPYEKNRVQLSGTPPIPYYNASHIQPPKNVKGNPYIACGAPQNGLGGLQYAMICQQKSPVSYVLATPYDGNSHKQKMEIYWPTEVGKPETYHGHKMDRGRARKDPNNPTFTVQTTNITPITVNGHQVGDAYTLLIFDLSTQQSTEHIIVHYRNWGDHGAPNSIEEVETIRDVGKKLGKQTHNSGPEIVHCSGGIGRTGTFIALDYLADVYESKDADPKLKSDPVPKLIESLRDQRMNMVQTQEQLNFIAANADKVARIRLQKLGAVAE